MQNRIKILLIPIFFVILFVWIVFQNQDEGLLNLEKHVEFFHIDENCDCEQPDEGSPPELDLSPKEVIFNFFGYLKANEYKNLPSFFAPEVMLEYFYADPNSNSYYQRVQEFGEKLSQKGELEDVRIISVENEFPKYHVKIELIYPDRNIEKEILLEQRTTPERLKPQMFILTTPSELIDTEN